MSRDARLLDQLKNGQAQAYVEAVDQYYGRIYAFLYRMAQDESLAEDLTQETFAAAWRSLSKFEGRSSFSTWLHKIALNAYRDFRRRKHPETVPLEADELLICSEPAPDLIEQIETEHLRRRIEEAVVLLPEIYREVLILRFYQGLKYREVAELLDVPAATVRFRAHVAFKKLRAELGEEAADRETIPCTSPSNP